MARSAGSGTATTISEPGTTLLSQVVATTTPLNGRSGGGVDPLAVGTGTGVATAAGALGLRLGRDSALGEDAGRGGNGDEGCAALLHAPTSEAASIATAILRHDRAAARFN